MASKVKHVDGREGDVLESNSKQSLVLFRSPKPVQPVLAVYGDPLKKTNFTVEHRADSHVHFESEWVDNEHLAPVA